MFNWDTIDEFFTDDFAEDVIYDGVQYRAVVSLFDLEKRTEDAGRYGEVDMTVRFRASDLDSKPETGDTITVRGVIKRILSVSVDSTHKSYICQMVDRYN